MSGLIGLLNALAQAALAEQPEGAALRVRTISLEGEGGHLQGRIDHTTATGEFTLRFTVEAPQGAHQSIQIVVEQWPEQLPPALEPFRTLLTRARLRLDLDFTPPT